jgi:uncharacterized RDD family membrane protein YckC
VLIDLVALVVGAATALAVSVFHLPKEVRNALLIIGGVAFVLWTIVYFVAFWSTTGQTPGARMMQIRLVHEGGRRVGPRRGVLRVVGMLVAALPLFAGYALIVFDKPSARIAGSAGPDRGGGRPATVSRGAPTGGAA